MTRSRAHSLPWHLRLLVLIALLGLGVTQGIDGLDVRRIATGRELVAALADASASKALVMADILLQEGDFVGRPLPLLLRRNFTVAGGLPAPALPLLNLGFVKGKVQLLGGAVLGFEGLAIDGARLKPQGNSPGADLLAASPAGPRGTLLVQNGILINRFCFPRQLRDDSFRNLVRSEGYPGPNRLLRAVSQEGCVNDTAAPAAQRCWADAGRYLDVALDGADLDDMFVAWTPTNYTLRAINLTFVCTRILPDDCIAQYSPVGCMIYSLASLRPSPPPPAPSSGGSGSASGGGRGGGVLVPALVGALGGAALLVAVGAGIYGVRLQRRRRRSRSLAAGPVAATSLAGGHCGTGPRGKGQSMPDRDTWEDGAFSAPSCRSPGASAPASLRLQLGSVSGPQTAGAPLDAAQSTLAAEAVVTSLTPPRTGLRLAPEFGDELTLLGEVLGKGTYGRVVVGMYRGERVAVKLLGDGAEMVADQESLRRSFAQEVEVLGRCDHPHVVRLLAASLAPPRPCLVMELMECSLERLLYGVPGQLLPLQQVLTIAIGIARGLAFLHPTIVHRDLKPANVLISNAGSSQPVVKIADFGLSRLRSTVGFTKAPEVGTTGYMSPETFDPMNYTVTHQTDMYALGTLVAEMIVGERPWVGASMMEVACSVTLHNRRPWRLEQLPPEQLAEGRRPAKLCRLIEACWECDARRRPAAAEAAKMMMVVLEELGESGSSEEGLGEHQAS